MCLVAQAGLELMTLLPQPPDCWDYRCVPTCLDCCCVIWKKKKSKTFVSIAGQSGQETLNMMTAGTAVSGGYNEEEINGRICTARGMKREQALTVAKATSRAQSVREVGGGCAHTAP